MSEKEEVLGYMAKHNLQDFMETAINELAKERPQEPYPLLMHRAYEATPVPAAEVVFVLGGPGSGKGTQCNRIRQYLGFVHLSAGDLLRAELLKTNSVAESIRGHMTAGTIVPSEITVGLLKEAMDRHVRMGHRRFLIDGFPRNKANMDAWDSLLTDKVKVLSCLFLNLSEELMTERLLERGKTSGRHDDNEETIKNRIKVYNDETKPILELFKEKNLCQEVDSTTLLTVDSVWHEVKSLVETATMGYESGGEVICALLKPDAVEDAKLLAHISRQLTMQGFAVLQRRRIKLRRRLAEQLFQSLAEQKHYEELIAHVTNGPCEVLVLRRDHALSFWKRLVGDKEEPENNKMPRCLRKQYGKDIVRNVAHVPETLLDHHRMLDLLYPENLWTVQSHLIRALIIAGPPASGKGTQCERIVEQYGLVHISTGDLLRKAVKDDTDAGKKAKEIMDKGELVPDELVLQLLLDKIHQPEVAEKGWLLDGFPRTPEQAQTLVDQGIIPQAVIVVTVPDEVLVERCEGRRTDPVTGKIYHLKFNPPPSDEVLQRCTQRDDDTAEKIKVRLKQFHHHMSAVEAVFSDKVCRVNGNQDPAKVFQQVRQHLD